MKVLKVKKGQDADLAYDKLYIFMGDCTGQNSQVCDCFATSRCIMKSARYKEIFGFTASKN